MSITASNGLRSTAAAPPNLRDSIRDVEKFGHSVQQHSNQFATKLRELIESEFVRQMATLQKSVIS